MRKIYIFSLGNPDLDGKVKYKYTRHNAARLVCDNFDFENFANEYNENENKNSEKKEKNKDIISTEKDESKNEDKEGVSSNYKNKEEIKIEHIIPDCYMNESGKFIMDFINYKNINVNDVIIAYDDIDINFADIKISYARSSGGHNGVESVIERLKTKDFYRLRVGIGEKTHKEMLLQDYVLSKLSEEEIRILEGNEMRDKLKKKLEELLSLI